MSRTFAVADNLLYLIVDGTIIGSLPFPSEADATAFGSDFVARDPSRQAAMDRHPAGKRRLIEVS